MAELRFNPLLGDWVMVASNRQKRPTLEKGACPFCPGSGKVPDQYEVLKYDNDFPVLMPDPPEPDPVETSLYKTEKSYGKCEVILYSPDHHATLPDLSLEHIGKLVNLWTDRFIELGEDPHHQYVLIFENRGEEVGVTMHHPHGQIYAYPFIPLKIKQELQHCKDHHERSGTCLLCEMNENETSFGKRIVRENEDFLAYLPFFTDYPYGVFIVSKSHKTSLADFTDRERKNLALILKEVTGGMDLLFERPFPYMMVFHQRPVNGEDVEDYYHFHIEFYPPLRAKDKLKYYASSEMGAWATANPLTVEETAPTLRDAVERFHRITLENGMAE
ncbi:MAG: galactose-1-phosphate uridylyltransferase [Thermicanus sp.]|nr:galactose-1-phosphate uridylyltransferase [Thermicanus sp.]